MAILKVLIFGVSFCQILCLLSIFFVYSLPLKFEQLLPIFVPLVRGIYCVTSEMVASEINHVLPALPLGKTANMQEMHVTPVISIPFSVVL